MFEGIRASLFFEEFGQRDWIFLFLNNINPFVAESVPVCCVHLHPAVKNRRRSKNMMVAMGNFKSQLRVKESLLTKPRIIRNITNTLLMSVAMAFVVKMAVASSAQVLGNRNSTVLWDPGSH